MADAINDRRKAFEEKFRMDQELQFKVSNRRNKLLGLWLGEQMGLTGADRDAYAGSVVAADFQKPGDDDLVAKVMADIGAKGVRVSEAEVRKKLAELAATAKEQVMHDTK